MKLVCLNVGLFEENNDRLRTFLKDQDPDFLTLQEVTKREVLNSDLSDHLPLILDFEI